ncbi:MAG TPA: hypothetical protein VGF99_00830 [Myxococcota bacterium]
MSTSPAAPITTAAFVAVVPDVLPPAHRLQRWQRRVVFAATLLIGVAAALVSEEVQHWRLGIDTGIRLDEGAIASVDEGSPAARAGAPERRRLWAVDDDDISTHHNPWGETPPTTTSTAVHISGRGRLFVRDAGTVRLRFDDDSDPRRCVDSTDVVVHTAGPRIPLRVGASVDLALPTTFIALLVAIGLGALAGRRPWRWRSTDETSRLRRRALLWPAVALSSTAPIFGHVVVQRFFGVHAEPWALTALVLTGLAHVALVVVAVQFARRRLDDDATPVRIRSFVLACFVPGLPLVLPPALCLLIGLPVIALLRNEARHLDD